MPTIPCIFMCKVSWVLLFNTYRSTLLSELNVSVILCCLFSESSSQALSVFNKANLLDLVSKCLERHSQNVELAISAGGMIFPFSIFINCKCVLRSIGWGQYSNCSPTYCQIDNLFIKRTGKGDYCNVVMLRVVAVRWKTCISTIYIF